MTPSEAAKLLAAAAAFDGRDAESEAAARLWAEALADVPADADTFASVTRYYSTPPENSARRKWLEPHHVRTIRQEIRDARIPDGAFTYPLPTGSETGAEFVVRRRQQIAAIADGRINAEPIKQLKGGPHPSVADALTGVGRMPDHVREALADALPGRRAREEARLRGDADALAIPCPWCHAGTNDPCKRRRAAKGDKPGTWFHRTSPHPGRVDAAAIAARACPSCHAPMGVPCAHPDGRFHDGVHPARQTARPAA
ncbi:hypothetical protein ACIRRH_41265 [Kitasatospora sp. NPDC101235]|uniref:zinc finger domain-containing protein n=1 Tax=Kitasatospora sp. NPDC101235 TaxID=3364101 RepID=UPI0038230E66